MRSGFVLPAFPSLSRSVTIGLGLQRQKVCDSVCVEMFYVQPFVIHRKLAVAILRYVKVSSPRSDKPEWIFTNV